MGTAGEISLNFTEALNVELLQNILIMTYYFNLNLFYVGFIPI